MHDRDFAPFIMAALAGVMANPVHAHKGAKPEELADIAIGAARATAAKLGLVETEERIAPARVDSDELEELRRRVETLEALAVAPSPEAPAQGA